LRLDLNNLKIDFTVAFGLKKVQQMSEVNKVLELLAEESELLQRLQQVNESNYKKVQQMSEVNKVLELLAEESELLQRLQQVNESNSELDKLISMQEEQLASKEKNMANLMIRIDELNLQISQMQKDPPLYFCENENEDEDEVFEPRKKRQTIFSFPPFPPLPSPCKLRRQTHIICKVCSESAESYSETHCTICGEKL